MKSNRKTKNELIKELESVRRKAKKLETQLAKHKLTQHDITERLSAEQAGKQAEEKLRQSEQKWRSFVSNSPDFIALHDREGRYLFLNHYAEGFTEKDINGKKAYDFISKESRDIYKAAFEECIRTMTKQNVEYSALGDNAETRMYESSFVPIMVQGNEINVLDVARDITERRLAEEKLRDSEARYRSLFENSIMGISQALPDGRLICANFAYAKMYGYENPEEIMAEVSHVGQQLYVNPEDREEVLRVLKEKGMMEPREIAVKHRDGTRFFVLVSAREIRDSKGNLLYYQAEHVDITERKGAEQKLRENAERLYHILEATSGGVWDWNIPSGAAVFSPGYARMLGYEPDEFARHYEEWGMIVHPNDIDRVKQHHSDHFNKKKDFSIEFRMREKSGRWHWIHSRGILIERDSQGNPLRMVGTRSDIQGRKQAEEEINKSHKELRMLANHLQNIREEERMHLAREFHDQLGQSMSALKMDLSLLLRMISDEKQDVQRKLIAEELQSMQKLVDETSQLLWAIIMELRPQMLDDLGLVATFEWEANQFGLRTGISCEFKSFAGDIQIDSKRSITLFRIYQEALTNVARHANATVVKSVLKRENEMLVLEIKDNGYGISIDKKSEPESFGLIGMRERALALGGLLEISGIAGEGTTIIVRLPLE